MEPAAAVAQPIRNPQCSYCAEPTRMSVPLSTRPEPVDEFLLEANPSGLVRLEVICHGRRDITPIVRLVIELGSSLPGARRACTIREPETLQRAYRALRGCASRFEGTHATDQLLSKLVVGGFLVLESERGNATGHSTLPIAHIVQHFARCG